MHLSQSPSVPTDWSDVKAKRKPGETRWADCSPNWRTAACSPSALDMSDKVADHAEPHRSYIMDGAKLFVVD